MKNGKFHALMETGLWENIYRSLCWLMSLMWHSPSWADTSKVDDLAACAGVVIGNGAVDFFMGDEAAFDSAADIGYTAYLSEVFSGQYSQALQIADQILGSNLDKVIAYNSETFDSDLYEEVVWCYRMLASQLMDGAQTIIDNQVQWANVKQTSINTIKRILRAG